MGIYSKAHKQVNRDARAMRSEDRRRSRDERGAMDRIGRDLLSTQKGQAHKLGVGNAKVLRKIMKLNVNKQAANHKTLGNLTDYEGALGSGANGELNHAYRFYNRNPKRLANADAKLGRAEYRYGEGISQEAKDLMAITHEDIKSQNASARYLASEDQLKMAGQTAEFIASQHHDISMAKMQAEAAMKAAKFQAKLDRRTTELARQRAAGEMGKPAQQAMDAADMLYSHTDEIMTAYNKSLAEGQPLSATQIASGIGQALGMETGDIQALQALASRLISARGTDPMGPGQDDSVEWGERAAAVREVIKTVPEWQKAANHKDVMQYINGQFKTDHNDKVASGEKPPAHVKGLADFDYSDSHMNSLKSQIKKLPSEATTVLSQRLVLLKATKQADTIAVRLRRKWPGYSLTEAKQMARQVLLPRGHAGGTEMDVPTEVSGWVFDQYKNMPGMSATPRRKSISDDTGFTALHDFVSDMSWGMIP